MKIIEPVKLKQLEDRTVRFGASIVKSCVKYNGDPALRPIVDQLIHSATSLGASTSAAGGAHLKSDFMQDITAARRAADKTRYWLRVLGELVPKENFNRLDQEILKLSLVLQKISSTAEEPSTIGNNQARYDN